MADFAMCKFAVEWLGHTLMADKHASTESRGQTQRFGCDVGQLVQDANGWDPYGRACAQYQLTSMQNA